MADEKRRGCFISSLVGTVITLVFSATIVAVALIVYFGVSSARCDFTRGDYSVSQKDVGGQYLYDAIVPVQWLHRKIGQIGSADLDSFRILDAGTYHGGHDEYLSVHIPHSLFFNTSQCLFHEGGFLGDLPDEDCFEEYMGSLGISGRTHVVLYDRYKNIVAARTWWTLRLFGHNRVSILDGGYDAWTRQGYETSTYIPLTETTTFGIVRNPKLIVDFDDMVEIVRHRTAQVVDSRAVGDFTGEKTAPGVTLGHMPGAINLPFSEVINDDKTFKSPSQLRRIFQEKGIDLGKPIVSTCRSGVLSTAISALLFTLGLENVPSYDGSWLEWNQRATPDLITTG